MTDDDFARIIQIRWCAAYVAKSPPDGRKDFKGFEVGLMSAISGYSSQIFGTVNGTDPDTRCTTTVFNDEELM